MAQVDPPKALLDHLQDRDLLASADRFEPLYGGRTNQVWKIVGSGDDLVLKLYRRDQSNPLFRNDPDLETRCLAALADTGLCPRLRASGPIGSAIWVLYEHAPGTPWGEGGPAAARLLGKVHRLDLPIKLPAGCNGSTEIEASTRHILSMCRSDERTRLARLKPAGDVAPLRNPCLIHGDPVAGNLLVDGPRLTLIDWQCPAFGDPAEDLAIFLSPAMMKVYRGRSLAPEEIAAFLNAYPEPDIVERYRSLAPWFAWRMAAYCLWRAENGAPDYGPGLDLERAALEAAG